MKINEMKLVYFSPTGTTRRLMMETARSIDAKSVSFDFSIYKAKKPSLKFSHNDFAIFGMPVYYGRVPALFMEYLENITGDGTPAALVAAYGCREYEDALLELKTELENKGFKIIGAAAFPTEHSLVPEIGARRPNKADLKEAAEYGIELNRRLRKEESFEQIDVHVPGNTPYRKYGKNGLVPKADSSLCTLCGACAKVCPAGAIPSDDPKKTDNKKCIGCVRCVRTCRQNARGVSPLKIGMLEKKLKKICNFDKKVEFFF